MIAYFSVFFYNEHMENTRGKLVLVGTPIGNLSDLSPRAAEALRGCDVIAAEDTRVTLKLLNRFGIKKSLVSYHEHNRFGSGERLAARMEAGETVALVTDAGMPAVSDPGEDLVALCHERGIPVEAVPGPTAAMTALALSGLPAGRFTFEGFLSVNRRSRREHLDSLKTESRTMIFYEAPHKLPATLTDLLAALGDRRMAVARELTKIHEEVLRTTLAAAALQYQNETPKGEFVLVIEGAAPPAAVEATVEEAAELAAGYMSKGLSASEAAKRAAAETGCKKGDIYRLLIKENHG